MRNFAPSGVLALLLLAGCTRDDAIPATDTARPSEPAPARVPRPQARVTGWNEEAGPLMVVSDSTPDAAVVVVPDATEEGVGEGLEAASGARGVRLDLFSRAGRVGGAVVTSVDTLPGAAADTTPSADDACTAWPAASLRFEGAPPPWGVAFPAGRATAVSMDSVDAWPVADSSRAVATVARIASALPGDTATEFRGLPFNVTDLWRLRHGDSEILVAKVLRRIGQEANPREQHLLLVLERDVSGGYAPTFVERTSGHEETVETFDVLAAVAIGPARTLTLVLSRDTDAGGVFVLLERTGARAWRARWTSAYAGC